MNKHTEEPWLVSMESGGVRVMAEDCDGRYTLADMYSDRQYDNARRIVACVNACQGIPTKRLEAGAADVLADSLELKEQRDELLAKLESLVGDVKALIEDSGGVYGLHKNGDPAPWDELVAGGSYEEWLRSLNDATDLIAKVKGGAA